MAANPTDASSRSDLADSYREFGRLLWTASDTAGGLENAGRELALREALADENPTNVQARYHLAVSRADIGEMLLEQGRQLARRQASSWPWLVLKRFWQLSRATRNTVLPFPSFIKKAARSCYGRVTQLAHWRRVVRRWRWTRNCRVLFP